MNALVVRALAAELDAAGRGSRVRRAGLLDPRELGLLMADRPEPALGGMLVLSVHPGAPHVRLEPSATRLDRRLTDQLGEAPGLLAGAILARAGAVGFERVLELAFEAHPTSGGPAPPLAIYFELLPRTPFLVVTRGGAVVAAIRAPGTRRADDRRMERGAPYHLPFGLGLPDAVPPARAQVETWLAAAPEPTPGAWAFALAPHLRGVAAEELAELLAGARGLAEAADRLAGFAGPVAVERRAAGEPALVVRAPGVGRGGSALAAVAEWARLGAAHERAVHLRTALARALRSEQVKVARVREGLGRDAAKLGDPAALRRQAEILLAHLAQVAAAARADRRLRRVELPDPYGGGTVAIGLDPRRSPAANAQAIFQAARRAERAAEHMAARARGAAAREAALLAAESRLAAAAGDDLLELARQLEAADLVPAGTAPRAGEAAGAAARGAAARAKRAGVPARLPYRAYGLGGGWEIRVGRSSADNDTLTHELARPHDLWLHAQGAAGSHVILRRGDGSPAQPPPAVLEAAAAAAAFFSQARHSRLVPVLVTEKRYVRKPRRSPPGTAACLREKTVMVAPRRPAGGEASSEE